MKKNFFRGLLFILVALFLGACSNSGSEETSTNTNSNHSESEETSPSTEAGPKIVRIAMSTEVDNLDPYLSAATDTMSMMDNVFDGLLDTNEAGELVPAIAESYDISDDGLTYTFKLKEGIKFHDGSDLTAEDVIYSYEKLSGLNGGEPLSSQFSVIEKIESASDYEVVITLKEKNSAFLAANIRPILPSGYEEQSSSPIGAGPFKFKEYKVGQELTLVKNEDYYDQENIPEADEVHFMVMPDSESSILAMQAGEIDIIPGISSQGLLQLGDTVSTVSGPQNMVQLMALNNSVEPLDDVKVRQAINLAIDKDVIIDTVADGEGSKLGSNFSPAMEFYYEPGLEEYYAPNIEEAKKLLAEAGLADGFTLELTVPSDYQFHVDTAQVIAEQLSQIGITVDIKLIEFSSWLEDVYQGEQYVSTIIGFTGKLDPYEILRRYESDYGSNFINYSNPEYDQLIADALAATDTTQMADLYKEAQQMLTEEAVSVFIMDPNRTIAMRKGLDGLKMYPIQKFNLEDLVFTE
ncbi:peptide/nickel transport system substrate-binding protein [Bacillus oleivorans]|uniref:Peptide/nickel transport system substrate-binding protein n=1 Tax=Bacillus oleivorans TaxID=1448271 RepID=A0A285D4I6_9BACI|nr:ABC transporter substrate-binding protein [Bacillus oleivorans]SNX74689.1 peptide/nickel transport system substrate-binding protein [Bacillus oleivorans]